MLLSKATYNRSLIHTATAESATQGDSQPVSSSQGEASAQGHLHTQLGGAGDRTSNLWVASQPALPPELPASEKRFPMLRLTERSLQVIGRTSLGMPDQLLFRSSSEREQWSEGERAGCEGAGCEGAGCVSAGCERWVSPTLPVPPATLCCRAGSGYCVCVCVCVCVNRTPDPMFLS